MVLNSNLKNRKKNRNVIVLKVDFRHDRVEQIIY